MNAGPEATPTELTTEEFLNQLRARRDSAIARFDYWRLTRQELRRAYEAGERNFTHATLMGANLRDADLMGANLRDADLRGANLRGANLTDATLMGANLMGADLTRANLRDADLRGANLRGANLMGADLMGADLTRANLRDANLMGADLRGADLTRANLMGADLTRANLRGANLRDAQADFWTKCMKRPRELAGLRAALVEGRVDGNVYEGECACFVGTLANIAHCDYHDLGILVSSNSPIERLFFAIQPGDTPENNPVSSIVVEWLDELLAFGATFNAVAKVKTG